MKNCDKPNMKDIPVALHRYYQNSNLRLVDSETRDVIDITMTPRLLKSYSKVYNDFMLKVQEDCFRKGAYYFMMNSEMPIEQMIGMF
jgi:hypothetical protein